MATDDEVGDSNIRAVAFDATVKQIAQQEYKFKQALNIVPTSAWTNVFYREDPTVLAGGAGNATKGIPRGATYPNASVQWERVEAVILKHGLEQNIPWEDILSNQIDVQARTLFRIARGVAKSVDDDIYATLSENDSVVNIQSINITTKAGSGGWNESSSAFIDDLAQGRQLLAEQNYDVSKLMLFINPRDQRSIVKYLTDKGAQFPTISADVATNGKVGSIMGIDLIVSNSVSVSRALLVIPKVCGTWKTLYPLTTITKEDPLKSVMIRSAELGITELHDPKAVVYYIGTNRTV